MTDTAQVRAQTILYKNDLTAVEKSVASIANAVRVSRARGGLVTYAEVAFGDASPSPIMDEALLASWNRTYGEQLRLSYTFFDENTGTSKGQNRLFRECQSEYLMVYNPDVVVCPTYFLEMMAGFSQTSGVGMVEARQTPLEHPKEYDIATGEEPWGAMACVIIPSAVYAELGGLDEKNFFMYCDDVDFSWRCRKSGRKILYRPNAIVFHAHHLDAKGRSVPTEAELYYSVEASLMMAYKWSNDAWLNALIKICTVGTDYQKRAYAAFKRRKEAGELPERLDADHKIAGFFKGGYSKNRF